MKTLEENKDWVKRDGKSENSDAEDSSESDDSQEEWRNTKKLLEKFGPKLHEGKKLTAEEMQEMNIDIGSEDEDDDDSDFDYQVASGENNALYESRLEDFDELIFVRDTLNNLN